MKSEKNASDTLQSQPVPCISIGMPVYNGEKYLSESLVLLLAQAFTDFELIISDNASTDKTEEICREYMSKDDRIRYIRQSENTGAVKNFDIVFQEARGKYFMWAAYDDRWAEDFLQTLYDAIVSDEKNVCAFCPYVFIDESGKEFGKIRIFNYSSGFRYVRLSKLCLYYDDGFVYGLFNRKLIKKMKWPALWSINAKYPLNVAYPLLFCFLSIGDFAMAGTSPLWFNRIWSNKTNDHIPLQYKNLICAYFALVFRKINILYESARYIYLGSKSLPLVVSALPALFVRFVFDCINIPMIFVKNKLSHLFSSGCK